ncbi:hypothetical protein KY326_01640 [Candidatus Woesearchaeota archaeon]|nr:hypothetical protein [Candidatus Woesearchaeota archaeon]
MNWKRLEIFLEFLVFGVVMGIFEDLIAVSLVTGELITLRTIIIVTLVAIPFAAFGELIVDKTNLLGTNNNNHKKKKKR